MATRLLATRAAPIACSFTSKSSRQTFTSSKCQWRQPHSQWRQSYRPFSSSLSSRTDKKYTQDHEWISLSADGKTATLGISSYAADALGDVIYVELPQTGMDVGHGDAIGAVESVKSASDIMTPVSGKIVDANSRLEETPGLLNKSPEDEAWIARIEVADKGEMEGLMGAEEYKKFTDEVGGT